MGCGGSLNDFIQTQGITDKKLLSCFATLPAEDEFNTIETFECHDIDLSDADISQLNRLPMLKKVVLNNTNLSTVEGFSTLSNLTYLDLENNYRGNRTNTIPSFNLSGISELIQLQTLNLSRNYINDLSHLSNLVNLEILLLNGINGNEILAWDFDIGPVDLAPLSGLEKLIKIELSGNYISGTGAPTTGIYNLAILANLNNLQNLDVSFSFIDPNSIGGFNNNIGSFTNLTRLNISENLFNYFGDKDSTVRDLSFITSLRKLEKLDLHSNIISGVEPLMNLMDLEYLDLSYNKFDPHAVTFGGLQSVYSLGDLSPLVTLTKLRTLVLTGSSVSSTDLENLQFTDLVNIIL